MTSKLILKEFDQWKRSNNVFSLYDYIFHEVNMNHLSTDLYFAFLELFWPTFITYKNFVFLKENFSEGRFKELEKQNEKIEFWINFRNLDPYFENDEDGEERVYALSHALVGIWQLKLKNDFPHLKFIVEAIEDKDAGDFGLTFYQKFT